NLRFIEARSDVRSQWILGDDKLLKAALADLNRPPFTRQKLQHSESACEPMVVPPRPANTLSSSQSGLSFNLLPLQICEEEMHTNQNDAPELMVEPHPQVRYKMISAGFFSSLR